MNAGKKYFIIGGIAILLSVNGFIYRGYRKAVDQATEDRKRFTEIVIEAKTADSLNTYFGFTKNGKNIDSMLHKSPAYTTSELEQFLAKKDSIDKACDNNYSEAKEIAQRYADGGIGLVIDNTFSLPFDDKYLYQGIFCASLILAISGMKIAKHGKNLIKSKDLYDRDVS